MRADRGVLTTLVTGGLAAWFVATVAGQHPQRAFDRVRGRDKLGVLIPDWRFFAPEPGQHDLTMMHRVRGADGVNTQWLETKPIVARRWSHAVWMPGRRHDKAMFDVANELCALVAMPIGDPTSTPAYRLLRGFAERSVRADHPAARGFQFMIVRSGGYDESVEPEFLFLSPYTKLA